MQGGKDRRATFPTVPSGVVTGDLLLIVSEFTDR